MKKVQKKEDPFKFIRKKVPPPGFSISGKRHNKKINRYKDKEIISNGIEDYEKLKIVGDI